MAIVHVSLSLATSILAVVAITLFAAGGSEYMKQESQEQVQASTNKLIAGGVICGMAILIFSVRAAWPRR